MDPHFRKGIAGVVYRMKDEKLEYLLLYGIHHGKGWKLLKGTERNMPEEDVLNKELDDEVKLKAKSVQKIPTRIKYEFPRWRQKGYSVRGQDLQVYAVEVDSTAQVMPDFRENFDYHWTGFKEARRLLKFEDHKKALEKADENIRKRLEMQREFKI